MILWWGTQLSHLLTTDGYMDCIPPSSTLSYPFLLPFSFHHSSAFCHFFSLSLWISQPHSEFQPANMINVLLDWLMHDWERGDMQGGVRIRLAHHSPAKDSSGSLEGTARVSAEISHSRGKAGSKKQDSVTWLSVPKMRKNGCFGRTASSVGAETREELHFGLHSLECVPGKLCWVLKRKQLWHWLLNRRDRILSLKSRYFLSSPGMEMNAKSLVGFQAEAQ